MWKRQQPASRERDGESPGGDDEHPGGDELLPGPQVKVLRALEVALRATAKRMPIGRLWGTFEEPSMGS